MTGDQGTTRSLGNSSWAGAEGTGSSRSVVEAAMANEMWQLPSSLMSSWELAPSHKRSGPMCHWQGC